MSRKGRATKAFYGAGNATRLEETGTTERKQEIFTPGWVILGLQKASGFALGQGLTLDPATSSDNPLRARYFLTEQEDGLAKPWAPLFPAALLSGFVFVNPPFKDLIAWLVKCRLEATQGCPIWMLCPFRPKNAWFGTPAHQQGREKIYGLRPFAFVGRKDQFPEALCIIGWNVPELMSLRMPTSKGEKEMRLGRWRFEP